MLSLPIVNLIKKRELVIHFSFMEIKQRYRGTYLSFLWIALEPLFLFSLLYVVFTGIREVNKEDFGVYLITGVLFYHLFVRGTLAGLTCIKGNSLILKSMNIDKEFFPVVTMVSIGLLMLVTLGVFFGLMPVFSFVPFWTIIFLPVLLVLFLLLILGFSYLLSIVYVYVKDIYPIWNVLMTALIFISPVFWYLDETEGLLIDLQKINPLGQIIELGHKIVFGQVPAFTDWLYTSSIVIGILVVGFVIFKKYEKQVVEKL